MPLTKIQIMQNVLQALKSAGITLLETEGMEHWNAQQLEEYFNENISVYYSPSDPRSTDPRYADKAMQTFLSQFDDPNLTEERLKDDLKQQLHGVYFTSMNSEEENAICLDASKDSLKAMAVGNFNTQYRKQIQVLEAYEDLNSAMETFNKNSKILLKTKKPKEPGFFAKLFNTNSNKEYNAYLALEKTVRDNRAAVHDVTERISNLRKSIRPFGNNLGNILEEPKPIQPQKQIEPNVQAESKEQAKSENQVESGKKVDQSKRVEQNVKNKDQSTQEEKKDEKQAEQPIRPAEVVFTAESKPGNAEDEEPDFGLMVDPETSRREAYMDEDGGMGLDDLLDDNVDFQKETKTEEIAQNQMVRGMEQDIQSGMENNRKLEEMLTLKTPRELCTPPMMNQVLQFFDAGNKTQYRFVENGDKLQFPKLLMDAVSNTTADIANAGMNAYCCTLHGMKTAPPSTNLIYAVASRMLLKNLANGRARENSDHRISMDENPNLNVIEAELDCQNKDMLISHLNDMAGTKTVYSIANKIASDPIYAHRFLVDPDRFLGLETQVVEDLKRQNDLEKEIQDLSNEIHQSIQRDKNEKEFKMREKQDLAKKLEENNRKEQDPELSTLRNILITRAEQITSRRDVYGNQPVYEYYAKLTGEVFDKLESTFKAGKPYHDEEAFKRYVSVSMIYEDVRNEFQNNNNFESAGKEGRMGSLQQSLLNPKKLEERILDYMKLPVTQEYAKKLNQGPKQLAEFVVSSPKIYKDKHYLFFNQFETQKQKKADMMSAPGKKTEVPKFGI